MLRHPAYRFRDTSTLARAIDDRTRDHQITAALLRSMGGRHNVKDEGSDSWTMHRYWRIDSDGRWKLRKWTLGPFFLPRRVTPGKFL
jgi:hypothetical protein